MPNMKVIFLGMLLLIISCAQAISKQDVTSADEQAHELNGNSYGNGSIQVSTRLNQKKVIVASKNEHKHELFVTTRYFTGGGGTGGGARGGGGMVGGGMGGGSARGGGGMVGGGIGGGGKGGSGMAGGTRAGSGRAGGVVGGAAAGMIGGGIIGGAVANNNDGNHGSYNFATTLSAGTHFCVSMLILYVSFWI